MYKLKRAFDAVFDANLKHRRGHHIQDLSAVDVARWLSREADELCISVGCDDLGIDEAGDVLVLLVHLARLCNWTLEDIEKAAIRKLRLRHGLED